MLVFLAGIACFECLVLERLKFSCSTCTCYIIVIVTRTVCRDNETSNQTLWLLHASVLTFAKMQKWFYMHQGLGNGVLKNAKFLQKYEISDFLRIILSFFTVLKSQRSKPILPKSWLFLTTDMCKSFRLKSLGVEFWKPYWVLILIWKLHLAVSENLGGTRSQPLVCCTLYLQLSLKIQNSPEPVAVVLNSVFWMNMRLLDTHTWLSLLKNTRKNPLWSDVNNWLNQFKNSTLNEQQLKRRKNKTLLQSYHNYTVYHLQIYNCKYINYLNYLKILMLSN